jgi:hypothetical protein
LWYVYWDWSVSLDSGSPWVVLQQKRGSNNVAAQTKDIYEKIGANKHLKKCLQYCELLQQSTRKASFSFDNAMKVDCTYRRSKFGRLSGLPALLTNWRKRRAHGRYVVRSEATVQLAAHIVGGADLVASSVAERE